ncbi:hypothetical protein C9374_004544 [Naegleria lovaniensis]|uniref:Uncharacterized protein n=1 Tax=Naegleria lovaniensis TaxID=51637 RepID=A0AA88KJG9_NAELO|nr:uncharacterized protein C9374_004544 [Naegleria lovaniensis]KAG2383207.1 hypothetical protein C9374_004544 [Naegleria lovaniensis]
MTEIPKLNLSLKKNNSSEQINNQNSGHSRVSSSDTNSSHDEGMLSPHGSSNANSTGTLGVSGGNSVISQFVEPLNHTKKSNASIHWRCVHVLEHPDFEMNALDDESSYHTSLQLLPFTIVDTVTQKSRYAIVHGSKRGVSVLELVEEFTQATDNRTGTQWTIKYHTKLESNGFGSSAVMLRKSSNKEKLIFFGGYFHENQETSINLPCSNHNSVIPMKQ